MTAQPARRQFMPALRTATQAFAPVQREFNRLFDELGAGWESLTEVQLSPRMDVKDTKDAVELTFEMPGIAQDDIKIEFEDDILTVSGEKKAEKETKGDAYRVSERSYGAFCRSIALPHSVDGDKIAAAMKDGVLTITAPKNGGAVSKTIEIQSVK